MSARIKRTSPAAWPKLQPFLICVAAWLEELCDEEVVLLLQHADVMARALVEIFLENRTTPE